ncbi:hypothetical protein [Acidianus sp. HS-5]|uniref:hypothetical protein n=1 Tax=Acidianus sp. HS-5 TaxID=2886040 RepID=UPI001F18E2D9|nr:hypothetical protein [Acidianus sp. HS-5]
MLRVIFISLIIIFLATQAYFSFAVNYSGTYEVHYLVTTYFNAHGNANIKVNGQNISVDENYVICNKSLEKAASAINPNISVLFNEHLYNSYYYTFSCNGSKICLKFYFTNSSELLIPYYLPINLKNGSYKLTIVNENITSGRIVQYNATASVVYRGKIINITINALCENPLHFYYIHGYYAYNKTNNFLQSYENIFSGRVSGKHGPLDFVDTLYLSRSYVTHVSTINTDYIIVGGIVVVVLLLAVLLMKRRKK